MDTTQILIIADALQVAGNVLIAFVVLSVHMHIMKEKSIDTYVIRYMRRERFYVVLGICFIVLGFLIAIAVRTGMV